MDAFNSGDKVLFHNGPGPDYIGTVSEPFGGGWIVDFVEGGSGTGGWFAFPGALTKIPDGAPIYRAGTWVQVATDTPQHAGACGRVSSPQFQSLMFGYWVDIVGAAEPAWVSAEVLRVLAPDGGEQR